MLISGKTLLDTNALLHFTLFPEKLSERIRDYIEKEARDRKGNLQVSVISALEIGLLTQKKRLPIKNAEVFWTTICSKLDLKVISLTSEVIFKSLTLFHMNSDPFDRIIVSTGMRKHLNLITSDLVIIEFFHKMENRDFYLKVFDSRK